MISDDYKQGYIDAITAVFQILIEEMDDSLLKIVFNNLKISRNE